MGKVSLKKERINSLSDIKMSFKNDEPEISYNKKAKHYINNKDLYKEMCLYHEKKLEALENGVSRPVFSEKIAKAIIQIAHRRCSSWKYFGYTETWKQEMISHAIMLAVIHGHNFDPNKSKNPFAYFTMIIDNGIKDQINREKAQLYIKYRMMENKNYYQATLDNEELEDNDFIGLEMPIDINRENRMSYVYDYEKRLDEKRNKKQLSKKTYVKVDKKKLNLVLLF